MECDPIALEMIFVDADKKADAICFRKYDLNLDLLSIRRISSIIFSEFKIRNVSQSIRLFNFFGLEILDDSDLLVYIHPSYRNKIIYFTFTNNSNNNIMFKCFKLEVVLGQGGFGKVYHAKQIFTGDEYAIKIITLKRGKFTSYLNIGMNAKFLIKEIEALAQLDYPKIIRLITYFYLSSLEIALVLEYAAGGTLRSYLEQKGIIEENEARSIIKSILEALQYCHFKGIIHRDLKLENIMYSDSSKSSIKLIDFGIAGIMKESINVGTIKYLPPEVVNGTDIDSKPCIDSWAVGCIIYELLTGKQLFSGMNSTEVKQHINSPKKILANSMSKEVSNLINNLIKIDPKERLSISDCLQHPWVINTTLNSRVTDEIEEDCQTCKPMHLSPVKKPRRMKIPSTVIKDNKVISNLGDFLRKSIKETSSSAFINHNRKGLSTKVAQDSSNYRMLDMNFQLLKEYGKIPNYLQPIGHSKDQKIKFAKLRENLMLTENHSSSNKRFSTIMYKPTEDAVDTEVTKKDKHYKLSIASKCTEASCRSGVGSKLSVDFNKLKETISQQSSPSPSKYLKIKKNLEDQNNLMKLKIHKPVSSCFEFAINTNYD